MSFGWQWIFSALVLTGYIYFAIERAEKRIMEELNRLEGIAAQRHGEVMEHLNAMLYHDGNESLMRREQFRK